MRPRRSADASTAAAHAPQSRMSTGGQYRGAARAPGDVGGRRPRCRGRRKVTGRLLRQRSSTIERPSRGPPRHDRGLALDARCHLQRGAQARSRKPPSDDQHVPLIMFASGRHKRYTAQRVLGGQHGPGGARSA